MKIGQKLAVIQRDSISPKFGHIISRYHGNTLSTTVETYVLHVYILRQTFVPNFIRISIQFYIILDFCQTNQLIILMEIIFLTKSGQF